MKNFRHHINSLVHAVCGSGKTEIVLESIAYAIDNYMTVGFAVPRVDVVKELANRFKGIFKNNTISVVYGGNTKFLKADLICLTTHQLYRYNQYFDLLIIDEIDAFPYQGNEVLDAFLKRSIRGNYIMMSATPSEQVIAQFQKKGMDILRLDSRFHMHPLSIPQIKLGKGFIKYILLLRYLRKFLNAHKPVFIFVPSIAISEQVFHFLNWFIKKGNYVHSKCEDRAKRIDDFRKGKYTYLVTTAVLERGVTIKNLQVIIFKADNFIYDSHALIQISGRVGRKKDAPTGEVIFIADEATREMDKCIDEIKRANASLQKMLQTDKR